MQGKISGGSDMARYEYQVVPAPSKGTKAKGVKAPEARFSLTLQDLMNEKGAEGWEYQRAETLPSEERKGLTGSATNWRHVLIFRRPLDEQVATAPQPVEVKPKFLSKPAPKTAEKQPEFVSTPRPAEPPKPVPAPPAERPLPPARAPRPASIPEAPSARESWTPEAPKPAPNLNPLAAPKKNPDISDV